MRTKERNHCEAVTDAFWLASGCTCDPDVPFCSAGCQNRDRNNMADLIARERAQARAEALEEAAALCDGIHMAEFKLSDGACAIGADCAEAIRALGAKP